MVHIRTDEIERVAVDRFTSTSGRYLFLLCSRFEKAGVAYDIVALDASTKKVRKIVRICYDNTRFAYEAWEHWKELLTSPFEGEEEPTDSDLLAPTLETARKDLKEMPLKMKPRGARIFVRDIQPIDEVTARSEAAGLIAVVDDRNKPKPTMGIIVAVGEDPLTNELYHVGDVVMFSKHGGSTFSETSAQYRSLELHEIIGVRLREDGLEDVGVIPTE